MVGKYSDICIAAIQKSGARLTSARRAVIACLESAKKPLTPTEIFEKTKKFPKLGKIDRVSVYRVLELLLENGLVHQISANGAFIACTHLFSCKDNLHLVTICKKCGDSIEQDLPKDLGNSLKKLLKEKLSFIPDSHFFQISGFCLECT